MSLPSSLPGNSAGQQQKDKHMKYKGISASAYTIIDDCLTAEINRLQDEIRQANCTDLAGKAELLGKLKAARSEFISIHVAS